MLFPLHFSTQSKDYFMLTTKSHLLLLAGICVDLSSLLSGQLLSLVLYLESCPALIGFEFHLQLK